MREMQNKIPLLLIYLPCYTDFRSSIIQAGKIQEVVKLYTPKLTFEIRIMISVNGVNLGENDSNAIKKVSDFQVIYPFGISGDINITQGYMHSIRLQADYLWILSSNDSISDTFLETISTKLVADPTIDFLVACTSNNLGIREIDSVFSQSNRDVPFGLISAVVYRTSRISNNFDSAVQLNWTGWGQLAVIESACISLNGTRAVLVREVDLYNRSERTLVDPIQERARIRNGYSHSFFGMPILISVLYDNNPRKRAKLLNSWIQTNWYLVHYFLKTDFKLWSNHMASNQHWLRQLSFSAVKNASFLYRGVFRFSRYLDIARFQNLLMAQRILKTFQNKL